jgi:hypothetical protein
VGFHAFAAFFFRGDNFFAAFLADFFFLAAFLAGFFSRSSKLSSDREFPRMVAI